MAARLLGCIDENGVLDMANSAFLLKLWQKSLHTQICRCKLETILNIIGDKSTTRKGILVSSVKSGNTSEFTGYFTIMAFMAVMGIRAFIRLAKNR